MVLPLPLCGQEHFNLFSCEPTGVPFLKAGLWDWGSEATGKGCWVHSELLSLGLFGHLLAGRWDVVLSSDSQSVFPGDILHQLRQHPLGTC